MGGIRVDWGYDLLLLTPDVHVYLKINGFVRAWSRLLRWWANSWFFGCAVWLECILFRVFVKFNIILIQIYLVIFVFMASVIMKVLKLIWKLSLLFSMTRSFRSWWDLRLERCLFSFFLIIPSFEILLFLFTGIRSIIQPFFNRCWSNSVQNFLLFFLSKLIGSLRNLRPVLWRLIVSKSSSLLMSSFVVHSKFILSIVVQVSVGSCYVFNFGWFKKEALIALSAKTVWVNTRALPLWVHDILMMEILIGS